MKLAKDVEQIATLLIINWILQDNHQASTTPLLHTSIKVIKLFHVIQWQISCTFNFGIDNVIELNGIKLRLMHKKIHS